MHFVYITLKLHTAEQSKNLLFTKFCGFTDAYQYHACKTQKHAFIKNGLAVH